MKKRIRLDVIFDNSDHCAKKAIPSAVKMVLANAAISFCLNPQIPESKMAKTMVVNKFNPLIINFHRSL